MNPIVKLLHMVQWAVIGLLHIFPLVIIWPFVDITGWQAFLPVGLVPLGAFVVIPLALLFKVDMKALPLYGNKEEGCPEWWLKMDKPAIKDVFPRWWWFAVRNPVNNMRFLFDDDEPFDRYGWQGDSMEAHDLIEAGVTSASLWRRRGLLAGYRRVWLNKDGTYGEIWFGWKVGSIVPGLGFATQFRPKNEIGT
jgi:hypothetical protein